MGLYRYKGKNYVYDSFGRTSKQLNVPIHAIDTEYDAEQILTESNCGQRTVAFLACCYSLPLNICLSIFYLFDLNIVHRIELCADCTCSKLKYNTGSYTSMSNLSEMFELGWFGNVWVRQHSLHKTGDFYPGHTHKFDHVTLLVRGRVQVEIAGHPPKEFQAPTFIVIKKEHEHKMTALEDDCIYYCVFALRNIDGEVVEDIYTEQHDPLTTFGTGNVPGPLEGAQP
jgi:hypothetical protein